MIEDSLKKVVKALNLNIVIPPEELIAQSIEQLNYAKSEQFIKENIAYYYKNILFIHFTEKIPEYLASNKSFKDFIPELFKSFNPEKEISRWHKIEKRIKGKDL